LGWKKNKGRSRYTNEKKKKSKESEFGGKKDGRNRPMATERKSDLIGGRERDLLKGAGKIKVFA